MTTQQPNETDRQAIRMLVRLRDDFQAMRKRMDNRIGRKADGTAQDIDERPFRAEDLNNFTAVADNARQQEREIEKMMLKTLKRFPVYREFLSGVKGVGPVSAGWLIGEIDIHKATTVSKIWQFTGLNPHMVRGKKRKDRADGGFDLVQTNKLIRGDRLTSGFVAPYNQRLRTALCGVMADGFIKSQNTYCLEFYYPYKQRLEQSDRETSVTKKGGDVQPLAWKDTTKGHRDRAAKRYMVKMFLFDLYKAWREIEGLNVRVPYAEEYLGKTHEVAV